MIVVWVAVEIPAAEDWVRPDVVSGESAAGESRRDGAFHRGGLRLSTSLARGSVASLHITAKAAAVLTAVLPSALVKATNMEPVKFASVASAD